MPRYFTEDHEWIEVDGDTGTVGITDYAQSQLGDITFVELPEAGSAVNKGDAPCVVDSVKAASDVYAPVSGTVTESNAALEGEPELVNNDAETGGWLFRLTLSDPAELDG
ncbi:MAG TPA: glycine cleavage system protein GcvH, partial [Novosphingobium sp.]|nr:glycine cleavage system protein GcvH [Novosphingobium sp.]